MIRWFVLILFLVALPACSDRPAPTASGPSAAKSRSGTIDETTSSPPWSLLGVPVDDPLVEKYLSTCSSKPEREEFPDYGVFLSLKRDGVELSADKRGSVMTVIVYGHGSNTYDKYSGTLPRGLKWDMTRAEVERLLGSPHESSYTRNSTTDNHEYYAEYPELGMFLTYQAKSADDLLAKLLDMRVKKPRRPDSTTAVP